MATWLVGHTPWLLRARLRLDVLPLLQARHHLNMALQTPSPASLEIETMPYPTAHPDTSVFEPMSNEYVAVSNPDTHTFTPLSSSDTLASLVLKGDFLAAESLRKEMISHHIPIVHDVLYLRAATHAITPRHDRKWSSKERVEAFEAWLALTPDRHQICHAFCRVRRRLFRSMDHLNLTLIYRFGLAVASKGYYGGPALQAVATLARYATGSVLESYLCELEDVSRNYYLKKNMIPPPDLLSSTYSLSIRTVALAGKGEAALALVAMARSRGIPLPDFTLNIVIKQALDPAAAIDKIRALYPSWTVQVGDTYSEDTADIGHTTNIAELAARLRSLRTALRSHSPPSPQALHSFITAYQSLGRSRVLPVLRRIACHHSQKSAMTWTFTQMLYYRTRLEYIHLLVVFARCFHPVGVPRKALRELTRSLQGRQIATEHLNRWGEPPRPGHEKLWPSTHATALVWEAIVAASPKSNIEGLYTLLLFLVRKSKRREVPEGDRHEVELPSNTFDAAHFSPFASWWARRDPVRAARVLLDMFELGIEPSVVQWSLVARGYAQHDDPNVALNILDRVEEIARSHGSGNEDGNTGLPSELDSDGLLGVHTNVLRGFVIAEDVAHAQEVERWLMERLGYRAGDRPRTDATIALLRALESRLEQ